MAILRSLNAAVEMGFWFHMHIELFTRHTGDLPEVRDRYCSGQVQI